MPNLETFNLDEGVEIFRSGTWNGDTYTQGDLQDMVHNFYALENQVKPPMKLGHSEDQYLLRKEGLPSAGWIKGLKLVGDRLIATIGDVPKSIYNLLKAKAYSRVSAEVYPIYKEWKSGKMFKNVLRAVAFLGADIPAVDSLQDVLNLYDENSNQPFKIYTLDGAAINITVGYRREDFPAICPGTVHYKRQGGR